MTISRGQSWEYIWSVRQRDAETGLREPIASSSVVRAWLSETFKGDPITPASVVRLAQGALGLRIDNRVQWSAVLGADDVTDALDGILTGDQVAEVLEVDGERYSSLLTVAD